MTKSVPRFISVDWGTTSLRCYLAAADGRILGLHTSPDGIMSIPEGRFGATLEEALRPWITSYGWLPIVMSGMVGSRQGWQEAPYLNCPVELGDLEGRLIELRHEGLPPIGLVPGIDTSEDDGTPDVMRGEEMQIFGALRALETTEALILLPGTHAKWAVIENGAITSFRTYMTGEVFAALKDRTILARLMKTGPHDAEAFRRGVKKGAQGTAPGDLLHSIFSARTRALFDQLAGEGVESYLSGLLIGSEIVSASAWSRLPQGRDVLILASDQLADRYRTACDVLGKQCTLLDGDSVVLGHLALVEARLRDEN